MKCDGAVSAADSGQLAEMCGVPGWPSTAQHSRPATRHHLAFTINSAGTQIIAGHTWSSRLVLTA